MSGRLEIFCHSNSSEKPLANAGMKNTKGDDDDDDDDKNNDKLLLDFDIQMDPLISKKKLKESEKKHKYLDLSRELKNYGTWRWKLYQWWLVHLVQSLKDY